MSSLSKQGMKTVTNKPSNYFVPLFKKPRINISEEGVTSVSVSEVLLTDVADRQLKALEELIKQGLLSNTPNQHRTK